SDVCSSDLCAGTRERSASKRTRSRSRPMVSASRDGSEASSCDPCGPLPAAWTMLPMHLRIPGTGLQEGYSICSEVDRSATARRLAFLSVTILQDPPQNPCHVPSEADDAWPPPRDAAEDRDLRSLRDCARRQVAIRHRG